MKSIVLDFNGLELLAPIGLEEYLRIRYGDFMKIPSEEKRKEVVHAKYYSTEIDYRKIYHNDCMESPSRSRVRPQRDSSNGI